MDLALPAGLEPATQGFRDPCSNQLNYGSRNLERASAPLNPALSMELDVIVVVVSIFIAIHDEETTVSFMKQQSILTVTTFGFGVQLVTKFHHLVQFAL